MKGPSCSGQAQQQVCRFKKAAQAYAPTSVAVGSFYEDVESTIRNNQPESWKTERVKTSQEENGHVMRAVHGQRPCEYLKRESFKTTPWTRAEPAIDHVDTTHLLRGPLVRKMDVGACCLLRSSPNDSARGTCDS